MAELLAWIIGILGFLGLMLIIYLKDQAAFADNCKATLDPLSNPQKPSSWGPDPNLLGLNETLRDCTKYLLQYKAFLDNNLDNEDVQKAKIEILKTLNKINKFLKYRS